ncbi:phosphate deficiency response 2 [Actinidia rufa]|uniref:Phosphate deficiency response 2 n=1 Tax=Actinidia rufa TaxID=165716 RepID=A0A7J0DZ93_9ERIC|nr:phosphate deficiency response 2 [Actinidia rufa]
MAKSRLKTLTELRRVRVDGQTLMVHRCGKWVKLSGMDLLPGDVVSIGRSTGENGEDKSVPEDMLILAGSALDHKSLLMFWVPLSKVLNNDFCCCNGNGGNDMVAAPNSL